MFILLIVKCAAEVRARRIAPDRAQKCADLRKSCASSEIFLVERASLLSGRVKYVFSLEHNGKADLALRRSTQYDDDRKNEFHLSFSRGLSVFVDFHVSMCVDKVCKIIVNF